VLAHEREGDGGSQAAEGAGVGAGVDVVPCAGVGEAGLLEMGALEDWILCGCRFGMYLSDELRHGGGGNLPSRAQGLLSKGGSESMVFFVEIAVEP